MYYPNYDSTGVYIHTNNVWEDRALGPHQQQRCSNVSYARSQVRGPHNHIFVSQTIYFTLLHSLKTRLFINPVLNNPDRQSTGLRVVGLSAWVRAWVTTFHTLHTVRLRLQLRHFAKPDE